MSEPNGSPDRLLAAYRVLAIVVGIGLLTLLCVGMPLEYAADKPGVARVVGPVHGFLYVVYLILAFQLWQRERWNRSFAAMVLCAGFVPFLSFYVERRVNQRVRADHAARARATPAPAL
jgi:integral membrane protein